MNRGSVPGAGRNDAGLSCNEAHRLLSATRVDKQVADTFEQKRELVAVGVTLLVVPGRVVAEG
jgi:hypothetical protein